MAYKILTNCFQHTHSYLQRCVVVSNLSVFTVMALLMMPRYGIAASVDYNHNYKDVIGNAPFLNGPISIGGTNNLESHKENIYASGNTVNIISGVVDFGIYGGYHNGTTTSADIESSNNTVTIGSAFAGHSGLDIYGGYARSVNPFSTAGLRVMYLVA